MLVSAQNLQINHIYPLNLSQVNLATQEISITFNQAVNPEEAAAAIRIFGDKSGSKDFTFHPSNNNRTIKLSLKYNDDLVAGEKVSIKFSADLVGSAGKHMKSGYTAQYFVKTKPGSLLQSKVATIPLRQAGDNILKATGAFVGDLNNDGYTDLTVINEATSDLRILMNDQAGSYGDLQVLSIEGTKDATAKSADFDRDGKTDFAIGSSNGNVLNVLLGDGRGDFSIQKSIKQGNGARAMAVIDIDSDGDDDIVLANQKANELAVMINDGLGNFNQTSLALKHSSPTAIESADANNDGILDLFVGYKQSQKIGILLGDGNGGFDASDEVEVIGQPWMLAIADLNGDNFADVASVNANGNVAVLIMGDGTGGLLEPKNYALQTTKLPRGIDLGDIDGDGDMDMVTANYESNNFIVWENNAQGIMSRAAILTGSKNPAAVVLDDRDNDGDLDIIGTDATTDEVILFENASKATELNQNPTAPITAMISPNPFQSRLKIKANIPRTGRTDVRILDGNGRTMVRLWDDRLSAGEHYFGWDGRSESYAVPSGIYYVTIIQNGKTYSWPVSKW